MLSQSYYCKHTTNIERQQLCINSKLTPDRVNLHIVPCVVDSL